MADERTDLPEDDPAAIADDEEVDADAAEGAGDDASGLGTMLINPAEGGAVVPPQQGEPGKPGQYKPVENPMANIYQLLYDKKVTNLDYGKFMDKMQDRAMSDKVQQLLVDKIRFKMTADQFYDLVKKNAGGGGSLLNENPDASSASGSGTVKPSGGQVVPSPQNITGTEGAAPAVPGKAGAPAPGAQPAGFKESVAPAISTDGKPVYADLTGNQQVVFDNAGGYKLPPEEQSRLVAAIKVQLPATIDDNGPNKARPGFSFSPLNTLYWNNPTMALNARQLQKYHDLGGDVLEPEHRRQLAEIIMNQPPTENETLQDGFATLNAFVNQPEQQSFLHQKFTDILTNSKNKGFTEKSLDEYLQQRGVNPSDATYNVLKGQMLSATQNVSAPLINSLTAALDTKDWGTASKMVQTMAQTARNRVSDEQMDVPAGDLISTRIQAERRLPEVEKQTAAINDVESKLLGTIKRMAYPKYAATGEAVSEIMKAQTWKVSTPDIRYDNSDILSANAWSGMMYWKDFEPQKFQGFMQSLREATNIDPITKLPYFKVWNANTNQPLEKDNPDASFWESPKTANYGKSTRWDWMVYYAEQQGQEINSYVADKKAVETLKNINTVTMPAFVTAIKDRNLAIANGTYMANKDLFDAKVDATQEALHTDQDAFKTSQAEYNQATASLYAKFPEQVARRDEMIIRDITDDDGMIPMQRFLLNFAGSFTDAGNGLKHFLFSPDNDERQDMAIEQDIHDSYMYMPQNQTPGRGAQFIRKVAPEHEANVNAIINNKELNYDQRKQSLMDYIEANPGAVRMVRNPNAGEYAWNVPKFLNAVSNTTSQLAAFMLTELATEGAITGLQAAKYARAAKSAAKLAGVAETAAEGAAAGAAAGVEGAPVAAAAATGAEAAPAAETTFNLLRQSIRDAIADGKISEGAGADLLKGLEYQQTTWAGSSNPTNIIKDFVTSKVPWVVARRAPIMAFAGGQAFDRAYNEAIQSGKSPEEAESFARSISGASAAMAAFFPDADKFRGALGLRKTFNVGKDLLDMVSDEAITYGQKFLNGLKGAAQGYATSYAETVGPLALQSMGDIIAQSEIRRAYYPQYNDGYGMGEKLRDAFTETAISNVFTPAMAGVRGASEMSNMQKDAIWWAATQPTMLKQWVNDAYAGGRYTAEVRDQKIQAINTANHVFVNMPNDFTGKQMSDRQQVEWLSKGTQLQYVEKQLEEMTQRKAKGALTDEEIPIYEALGKKASDLSTDMTRIRQGTYFNIKQRAARAVGQTLRGSTDYDRPENNAQPVAAMKVGDVITMPDETTVSITAARPDFIELRDEDNNLISFKGLQDFNQSFVEPHFGSAEAFSEINPLIHAEPTIRPGFEASPVTDQNPLSQLAAVPGKGITTHRVPLADLASEFTTTDPAMQAAFTWAKDQGGSDGNGALIRYQRRGLKATDVPVFYDPSTKAIVLNAHSPVVQNMTVADMNELVGHEVVHMALDHALNQNSVTKDYFAEITQRMMKALRNIDTGQFNDTDRDYVQAMREANPMELITYAMVNPRAQEILAGRDVDMNPIKAKDRGEGQTESALDAIRNKLFQEHVVPELTAEKPQSVSVNPPAAEQAAAAPIQKPQRLPDESYFDYSKRVQDWHRQIAEQAEASASERRTAAVRSREERLFLQQVGKDAKVLRDSAGQLTPEEFNQKQGYPPGSLESYVAAMQALTESKEEQGNKALQKNVAARMEALRADPKTRGEMMITEADLRKKQWQAFVSGHDSALAHIKEQEGSLLGQLADQMTLTHAQAKELQRLRNLRDKRVADFKARRDFYIDKVVQMVNDYRKTGELKNKDFTDKDITKLLKSTMHNYEEGAFDNLHNIVKGIVETADYKSKVEGIATAKEKLRKMLSNKSLTGADKDAIRLVQQYGPTNLTDVGQFHTLLNQMIQDYTAYEHKAPGDQFNPTVSRKFINDFVGSQAKSALTRSADAINETYKDMQSSGFFTDMNEAGKLTKFPDAKDFAQELQNIVDRGNDPKSIMQAQKELGAYADKLGRVKRHLAEMERQNYSTGVIDFNNQFEKAAPYQQVDSNRQAIIERYQDIMNDPLFKELQGKDMAKNFPDMETLKVSVQNAKPDELRAIGKRTRDVKQMIEDLKNNKWGQSNTDQLAQLDYQNEDTYLPPDRRTETFKGRYRALVDSPFFFELERNGKAENFPSVEDFDKMVDGATTDEQKVALGKKVREIENAVRDIKKARDDFETLRGKGGPQYLEDFKNLVDAAKTPKEQIDLVKRIRKAQGEEVGTPTVKDFENLVDGATTAEEKIAIAKQLHAEEMAKRSETAPENTIQYANRVDFEDPTTYSTRKAGLYDRTLRNQEVLNPNDPAYDALQSSRLKYLKDVDISRFNNKQLQDYNAVLRNIVNDKNYDGWGQIKIIHDAQRDEGRKAFDDLINKEKYQIRDATVKGFLPKFRESTMSSDTWAYRMAGDQKTRSKLATALGWSKVQEGFVKARHAFHNDFDAKLSKILKEEKIVRDDAETNAKLSFFGWLRQNQEGTEADKQAELSRRFNEIVDNIEAKSKGDKRSRAEAIIEQKVFNDMVEKLDNKYGIKLVEKKPDGTIQINSMSVNTLTPEKIAAAGILSPGEQKIYDLVVDNYKKIRPEFLETWRLYGNKDISDAMLWNNYVKDAFRIMHPEGKAPKLEADFEKIGQGNFNNDGDDLHLDNASTQERTAGNRLRSADAQHDAGASRMVINTNFIDVNSRNLQNMHNDVHTLEPLRRAGEVFKDQKFVNDIGGSYNANILKEKLFREATFLGGNTVEKASESTKAIAPLISTMRRVAALKQLATVAQAFTQAGSQLGNAIADLAIRGRPDLVAKVWADRKMNKEVSDAMGELMDKSLISQRQELEGGTRTQRDENLQHMINTIDSEHGKAFNFAKKAINRIDALSRGRNKYSGEEKKVMMNFLQSGDAAAGRTSFLAYYAQHLLDSGAYKDYKSIDWAKEAANPNRDAQAYAQNQVATLQNVNAQASLPKYMTDPNTSAIKSILGSFASFQVNKTNQWNEAMRAFIGAGKLQNKEQRNQVRHEAMGRIAGLIGEEAVYNAMLKPMVKFLISQGATGIVSALGAGDADKDREAALDERYGRGFWRDQRKAAQNAVIQNLMGRYLNTGSKLFQEGINKGAEFFDKQAPFPADNGNDYGSATAAFQNFFDDARRVYVAAKEGSGKDIGVSFGTFLSSLLQSMGWWDVSVDRMIHNAAKRYQAVDMAPRLDRSPSTLKKRSED